MKLLIEMDEKTNKDFHELVVINLGRCCGKTIMEKCFKAIAKGTPIYDNATNLDALMAVFPGVTLDKIMCVDKDWAKEPYKDNKENGDEL